MKLESAVYGLRNAPKRWYERLRDDLIKLGRRMHSIDACLFMFYDNRGQLVGIVGAYVDDCLTYVWEQFFQHFDRFS